MGRDTCHKIVLLKVPSSLALNTSREGASTASLGNLIQGLTTLTVKNFFLISDIFPIFPIGPLQVLKGCYKFSLQPALLQAEQPLLSQPFLIGEVFQTSDHFCGPRLDPIQQLHVLLVLRTPQLDTIVHVGSYSWSISVRNLRNITLCWPHDLIRLRVIPHTIVLS